MNTQRKVISILAVSIFILASVFALPATPAHAAKAATQYSTNMIHVHANWNFSNVQLCGTTDGGYSCTPTYSVSGNRLDVTWWFKIQQSYPINVKYNLIGYGKRECTVALSNNYNEYQLQSASPWATISYQGSLGTDNDGDGYIEGVCYVYND